jgi:hypothetical protein
LSPEIAIIAGADVVQLTEGRVATPQWPGVRDPAGVGEQGTFTEVPQEPGRPLHLLGESRREHRVTNSGPRPAHPTAEGANSGCDRDTARAKATKRGGRGGGESEHLIVPMTRGNRPEGPRRGKGVPGHETVGGKDAGDTGP